jgi:hypothetical protein
MIQWATGFQAGQKDRKDTIAKKAMGQNANREDEGI